MILHTYIVQYVHAHGSGWALMCCSSPGQIEGILRSQSRCPTARVTSFREVEYIGNETSLVAEGNITTYAETPYDLAVLNGFTGTEQEWLESLKGETGDSATINGLSTLFIEAGDHINIVQDGNRLVIEASGVTDYESLDNHPSINDVELTGNKTSSNLGLASASDIPDVSQFITNSANDLINYYLKTETYTQSEVNSLIGAISQFHYEIAASTSAITDPQSNVLYLIGPTGTGLDQYEEYVYPNSTAGFIKIGDTSIDLSGYVTTTTLNTALQDYQTKIDSTHKLDYSLIANTPTIPTVPTNVSAFTNDAGYLTSHQDISGKADKCVPLTAGNIAKLNAEGNLADSGLLASEIVTFNNIASKADKVNGATNGNFAGLDSNGNLTDSGKKASDFPAIVIPSVDGNPTHMTSAEIASLKVGDIIVNQTQTGDVNFYVTKVTGSTDGSRVFAVNVNEQRIVTITFVKTSGTWAYQDSTTLNIGNKADKVVSATNGHLAGLNASGNLTDSGYKPADFISAPSTAGTSGQVLTSDGQGGQSWQTPTSAVSDVTVGGTSVVSNGVAAVPAIPDVSGKENTSNKVTSFQTTPDDTHYPSEKLVKDSLDDKLDISDVEEVSAVDVDSTPTASSANLVTSGGVYDYVNPLLGKRGVISQTQTWSGTGTQPRTYVMSDLVYGTIPQANIDLFEFAGATFNATTGYFELNELTDISYEEIKSIYNVSQLTLNVAASGGTGLRPCKGVRTLIPFVNYSAVSHASSFYGINIETLVFDTTLSTSNLSSTFRNCYFLRKMINTLNLVITNDNAAANAFSGCYSLEELNLNSLKVNISFSDSSLLNLASVVHMVQKAANTSAITITLHADALARCTADTTEYEYDGSTYTGIVALATAKNITLAS